MQADLQPAWFPSFFLFPSVSWTLNFVRAASARVGPAFRADREEAVFSELELCSGVMKTWRCLLLPGWVPVITLLLWAGAMVWQRNTTRIKTANHVWGTSGIWMDGWMDPDPGVSFLLQLLKPWRVMWVFLPHNIHSCFSGCVFVFG